MPASACPLCGGPATTALWATDRNRGVSDERFEYRRCGRCGSLHLANVPADLGRYYPEDYFTFPSLAELDRGAPLEAYKLQTILHHVRGGRLVEIGPGFGSFARQASVSGFDVCGLEMDGSCCEHLRAVVGVEAVQTARPERALAELPPSDAIALWHSLEHLPDPWGLIAAAARNLRPGGVLVAALPNPQALGFRVLGARWPHLDAPRHLHLIPARTLAERARAEGLEPAGVTSDDAGARYWNAFGWGRVLVRPSPGYALTVLSQAAGRALALAAAPFERLPMRGSAYTIVLGKGQSAATSSGGGAALSASRSSTTVA